MKYILSLVLFSSILLSNDYYAKVEAYSVYNVKSSLSGKVLSVNKNLESKISNNEIIVQIDDNLNKVELKHILSKKNNIEKILKIQKDTLSSFKKVSSKSKLEKDKQKITVFNTQSILDDLMIKIATLEDVIINKTFSENAKYISSINVEVGDYINPGTLLYTAYDLSQGKLSIFVPLSDLDNIESKKIYLDDKKTDIKIHKIHKIADTKHIFQLYLF